MPSHLALRDSAANARLTASASAVHGIACTLSARRLVQHPQASRTNRPRAAGRSGSRLLRSHGGARQDRRLTQTKQPPRKSGRFTQIQPSQPTLPNFRTKMEPEHQAAPEASRCLLSGPLEDRPYRLARRCGRCARAGSRPLRRTRQVTQRTMQIGHPDRDTCPQAGDEIAAVKGKQRQYTLSAGLAGFQATAAPVAGVGCTTQQRVLWTSPPSGASCELSAGCSHHPDRGTIF